MSPPRPSTTDGARQKQIEFDRQLAEQLQAREDALRAAQAEIVAKDKELEELRALRAASAAVDNRTSTVSPSRPQAVDTVPASPPKASSSDKPPVRASSQLPPTSFVHKMFRTGPSSGDPDDSSSSSDSEPEVPSRHVPSSPSSIHTSDSDGR